MNKYHYFIAVILIMAGCSRTQPKESKLFIIAGLDTIIVTNGNIDCTKCRSSHGWTGTITGDYYFEFTNPYHVKKEVDIILSNDGQGINYKCLRQKTINNKSVRSYNQTGGQTGYNINNE